MVARALAGTCEPWWIIASAAVALHGVDPGPIGDVDILMSVADARRFCAGHDLPGGPGPADPRFRSGVFARWDTPPLTVEIIAGFKVFLAGNWRAISPQTRRAVATPGGPVYVPERSELAAILRMFGRPKDIARADLLVD